MRRHEKREQILGSAPLKLLGVLFFVLEIGHFRRFQLQLKLVSDQGDELRIGGFDIPSVLC